MSFDLSRIILDLKGKPAKLQVGDAEDATLLDIVVFALSTCPKMVATMSTVDTFRLGKLTNRLAYSETPEALELSVEARKLIKDAAAEALPHWMAVRVLEIVDKTKFDEIED